MLLREIAHARAGDKGNISNISVIAYDPADYPLLECWLTADRVRQHLRALVHGEVQRYTLPGLGAMNFVLQDALAGGVTRSLALDAHGKTLSSALLTLEIPEAGRRVHPNPADTAK
ncbi:hypothetical protein KTQ42_21190 [Noviherbaspirillum sp. L7-7A]|uniref:AtuA-related protein n=1 Tax=Noviherbaspirillum sp. L7-7A TaxID=2850560 RepID=UPI001C2BAE79|nr:hypothetical protein [Noviherbaspirillum sp. L7-7A]MBV0881797.1 hypothetical protein [Noviherbaspirillum sp. L7-7A]